VRPSVGQPPGHRALIDISIPLVEGTPEWPGDTPYSCGWTWAIERGDSVNVSVTSGSPHVGTHADAPRHVDTAWPASDALPIDAFIGPATVVDVSRLGNGPLERAMLPADPIAGGRLLLRTGRSISGGTFPDDWPWLSPQCVAALLQQGLRLVGVDAPSVDSRTSRTLEVHRAIFAGGAMVLENLDLREVDPGEYELIAAPLRLVGLDAAPVRAILRRLGPS
jgi:arylformamidase